MSSEVIVALIGAIASTIACYLNNKTDKKINALSKETGEALKCLMRSSITELYYKHQSDEYLEQYERENLDKMVVGYTSMGGNSFVKDIYETMRKWRVIK